MPLSQVCHVNTVAGQCSPHELGPVFGGAFWFVRRGTAVAIANEPYFTNRLCISACYSLSTSVQTARTARTHERNYVRAHDALPINRKKEGPVREPGQKLTAG